MIVEKTVEWGTWGVDYGCIDVKFSGEPKWENNGIGSYEYWGQNCFDKGVTYPSMEDSEVDWDRSKYTPEENARIEEWISQSENLESTQDSFCEKLREEVE